MSRKPLKTGDGEGFLRAFTDSLADAELSHEVLVTIALRTTHRKGVLEVTLTAWDEGERRGSSPRAKYTVTYPTAAVGTFEAALYQAAFKLDHILTQQALWPSGKA